MYQSKQPYISKPKKAAYEGVDYRGTIISDDPNNPTIATPYEACSVVIQNPNGNTASLMVEALGELTHVQILSNTWWVVHAELRMNWIIRPIGSTIAIPSLYPVYADSAVQNAQGNVYWDYTTSAVEPNIGPIPPGYEAKIAAQITLWKSGSTPTTATGDPRVGSPTVTLFAFPRIGGNW